MLEIQVPLPGGVRGMFKLRAQGTGLRVQGAGCWRKRFPSLEGLGVGFEGRQKTKDKR